jgi:hypothetical protein
MRYFFGLTLLMMIAATASGWIGYAFYPRIVTVTREPNESDLHRLRAELERQAERKAQRASIAQLLEGSPKVEEFQFQFFLGGDKNKLVTVVPYIDDYGNAKLLYSLR